MASEKKSAAPEGKAGAVPALRIRALSDGFRRAGRAWPARPVAVPVAEFTKEQIEALRREPQLVVEDCEL